MTFRLAFAALLVLSYQVTQAVQPAAEPMVTFQGMPPPATLEEMTTAYTTARVRVDYPDGRSETHPLGYHRLFTNLDRVGGSPHPAGQLFDVDGRPLSDMHGKRAISEIPDGNSLLRIPGAPPTADGRARLHLVTHWEYDWLLSDGRSGWVTPGWYSHLPMTMSLTDIAQGEDGTLTAIEQRPIDFSSVHGLWTPCAASVTPWNTHLGAEEDYFLYRRDKVARGLRGMTELYFRGERQANPYRYGHIVEVTVQPDGSTRVDKHYALGRGSFEQAVVMPDRRTVYMGDDGIYTALFMFVADQPDDLSAGTLYAARWNQTSREQGGSAELRWIRLGHAGNTELDAAIDNEVFTATESSIFEFGAGGAAPPGFTAIRAGIKENEYLRLQPGKEKVAAFLESRRYAAMRGATTEFNKMEAMALDPARKQLYLAMSALDGGMRGGDGGPQDHIRLPRLAAGAMYRLNLADRQSDNDGQPIDSAWVATDMSAVPDLLGVDLAQPDAMGNRAAPDRIANPDNVAFSPALRTLFIGEDTPLHPNNYVWAYHVDTGKLARILSLPAGAEAAGLQAVDEINGHAYLMASYQHVGQGVPGLKMQDRRLHEAVKQRLNPFRAGVGYISGLPVISR